MRSRLQGLFQLDNLVPALIIVVAAVVSLEPKILGVELSDRQVVLALFALLGINAIVERSGRLHKMSLDIDHIARHVSDRVSPSRILRFRATFQRTETLIADTKRSLLIIGINLQAATDAMPSILDLLKRGTTVRLLAIDPDGASLEHGAHMSGVDPELRRQKIRHNLDLIKGQLQSQLTSSVRRKCTLQVVDRILPVGAIGVDTESRDGWLIVQHYLTATAAERSPLIWLRRRLDAEWFDQYLNQCNACFDGARAW
jgi:hypothetical protein